MPTQANHWGKAHLDRAIGTNPPAMSTGPQKREPTAPKAFGYRPVNVKFTNLFNVKAENFA